jgi:outer membrane protein
MRSPPLFVRTAVAALLVATQARAETLADAIAFAYRSNPAIQANRYDLRAADEGVAQARAELRPNVGIQATASYANTIYGRRTAAENPLNPTEFVTNSNQIGVGLEQPLYTGGRATADKAVAEAQVAGQREALRGAEGDQLLALVTAYVDVRRYAAALTVWQTSVTELESLAREIRARRIAGEVTMTDVAQADAQIAVARQQVADTELSLETARADYAAVVGRDPGDLAEEPPLPHLPDSADTAFTLAERQSPDLAQARDTELASRNGVSVAASAGRPTVSLRGNATLGGLISPYRLRDQDQSFSGSVVVTIPLTAGGSIASQIHQAEDRNDADRFRIDVARRQVARAISVSWNQMASSERQVDLITTQRQAAAHQLDGMVHEYRVGLRSTFDVLYAQQSLRDADVALLGARRDRYVAEATLLRQTGLLEVRALMTDVPLYDPAVHLVQAERRNALPWDGAVAAIDRLAVPHARQKTLLQPTVARAPAVVPAVRHTTSDPLSHTRPTTPIAGTVGQPTLAYESLLLP